MAFALRGLMAAAATRPLLSTRLLGLRAFASEGAAGASADAASASGLVKLYVGNLSWSTTTAHLEEAFRTFGPVSEAIVLSDRFTGRSRGSGFVTMDATGAEKAIQEMNQREFMGRTIRVEVSTPRDPNAERPPRRNRDGGGGYGGGGYGGGGGGYGRGPRQYGGGGGGQDY